MTRYLVKRVLQAVLVLWGLATVVFFVLHLIPGDPVRAVLGGRASDSTIAHVRDQLGLNRPLFEQYVGFLNDIIHGNLGTSLALNDQVGHILSQRLLPSVLLIAYGMLFAVLIGAPLGIWAALRPNRPADHVIRFGTTFLFGMPTFWLALVLALVLALGLGWFPVSGYQSGLGGMLRTLTLPALTLGLSLVVIVTRTLRSNLIEVLKSEYIEAARSRGLSERRVVAKHALRNAAMPTLTILSTIVGYLIGSTVVLEQVFRIPGAGSLLVQSILSRDYQTVQAIALLSGLVVVAAGLGADLLQAVLDPRVRLAR
ncbi:ABC transporter permease [Diaminobutyricibacter sp. McL0618]|uniref:ABC transporter permease n=1 Tax=Leifsonia sp. McL0618 TaxID=3415677 RepID=UPI003CEABBAE